MISAGERTIPRRGWQAINSSEISTARLQRLAAMARAWSMAWQKGPDIGLSARFTAFWEAATEAARTAPLSARDGASLRRGERRNPNCGSNGSSNCGLIYEATPGPTACATALCSWNETTIYQFTGNQRRVGRHCHHLRLGRQPVRNILVRWLTGGWRRV